MMELKTTTFEERKKHMVSLLGDSRPTFRIAHFLEPTAYSTGGSLPKLPAHPCLSSLSSISQKLKVNFHGWRKYERDWHKWVHNLEPKYKSVWKSAGIYEALMNSTCNIKRDDDFVLGIAEKWCPETNTFIFPWGEATITLEDVIILGGYSIRGSPAFSCSVESGELKEIEYKLDEARRDIGRGPSKKACQNAWMKRFMDSGSEIEHEAFLSLWLARYVFPDSAVLLRANNIFFPIAVHLARGLCIALGPAVLASIYRDLSLLKAVIVTASEFETTMTDGDKLAVKLWSPFQLVQLWRWERFPSFRPNPNLIENGNPRSVLWDKLDIVKVENVRLVLDSAGETFCWRPYTLKINGWLLPDFYKRKEEWKTMNPNDNDDLSFALCFRVSELVGLDCIEQYLPNRVAMQFGMDQDVPAYVARLNETSELAWTNYIRPLNKSKLYFPPRSFKPDVTVRYLKWWRNIEHDMNSGNVEREREFENNAKVDPWTSMGKVRHYRPDVPPGFPPKRKKVNESDSVEDVKPTFQQLSRDCNKKNRGSSTPSARDYRSDVPPGFPPKPKKVKEPDSIEDAKPTFQLLYRDCNKKNSGSSKPSACENIKDLSQSHSIMPTDSGTPKEIGLPKMSEEYHEHVNNAMGNSPRSLGNETDNDGRSLVHNAKRTKADVGISKIPILELEARISRLENMLFKVKAGRLGSKLNEFHN